MMPLQSKPNSRVELRFRCNHLKNLDIVSKSDPQIFVSQKRGPGSFQFVDCTEKINNNLSPEFKKTIILDYYFEEIQKLTFTVMDIDKEIKLFGDLDKNDKIGEFTTSLSNILSRPGRKIIGDLIHHGKVTGNIEISAEEINQTNHEIFLRAEGIDLDKKDLFSSDPYFKIYKTTPSGEQLLVFQSVVIKNTLNPIWPQLQMKLEEFNGGDMFRELLIEVYDYDSIGAHDLIGITRTTTDAILRGLIEYPLINPKKTSKSGYKNSGVLKFYEARLEKSHSFLDYLAGGCEISLITAIDCTGSNGSVNATSGLHYNNVAFGGSAYSRSIASVGSVLSSYDSDGFIDVYGFGGEYRGSTSHCFPFSLDPNVPAAFGVAGVLEMYNNNISKIPFSGPTNFASIIQESMNKATQGQTPYNQKYTVLLIITDGEICDMDETIRNLVIASTMPISVVIVGVGSSSFENMDLLDGDGGFLKDYKGNKAKRDIVQFVPFNKFSNSIDALAQETLKEIPGQLLSYFKSVGIPPNPPRKYVPIVDILPPPQ
ncbi:hypothetical protein RB653_000963 [Dictyostelium firmibasis]|uniref:C2 domain-containing protein n=1 Tax=Dictyostelium firmibasis TaxID=79012 RepID=A0AAN7YUT9_9MYCE